jgi:hypothetical protein
MKTIQITLTEQQIDKLEMIKIQYNLKNQHEAVAFLINEKKIRIEEEI